jgi:outer membrane biosynthesis protein TonB
MSLFIDMAVRPSFLSAMMTMLCGMAMSHGLVQGVQAAPPKQAKTPPTARNTVRDDSPKVGYIRQVKELVEKQWNLDRSQRPGGVSEGRLRTEFYVNKLGKVEGLHVVDDRESHAILTGMTLRAIRGTTLPPMPDEVSAALQPKDEGRLKIAYDAVILPFQSATTPPETPRMPSEKPIPKALPVPDDEPVTRTTRNQDPNSFTPFTRQSQVKGTIGRGTQATVNAEETPKGRYMRQVTGQVEKKWHIYRQLRREGVTFGGLKLVFYVNKMGKVEDLKVINDKDSNKVLTEFTLQAIRDAEIPPMPADVIPLLPLNDRERLKVEYNVLIY